MLQYHFYDENGEIPIEKIASKRPVIHTVPTREQHDLQVKLGNMMDEELKKEKERGYRAYS